MIIIVLFNLSESVKFTSALNYATKNVVKYLWLGSKLAELKCRLFCNSDRYVKICYCNVEWNVLLSNDFSHAV